MERQAIRRGVFTSVKDLNIKIRTFIDGWNDRSHPFVWTKTADDILARPTVQQLQIRATSSPIVPLQSVHDLVPDQGEPPRSTGSGAAMSARSGSTVWPHHPPSASHYGTVLV